MHCYLVRNISSYPQVTFSGFLPSFWKTFCLLSSSLVPSLICPDGWVYDLSCCLLMWQDKGYSYIWLNIISGCVSKMFKEEIIIWINELSKTDCPSQCGECGSHPSWREPRPEQNGGGRNNSPLSYCWAGTLVYSCLDQDITLFQAFQLKLTLAP